MFTNFISKSLEFIQLLICEKIAEVFLFKRNEKKNRRGTLTPKTPFAARFSFCATVNFNSILKYFPRGLWLQILYQNLWNLSNYFVQTKITPAIFSQINSSINSEDFDIKFVFITPLESILIYSWYITNFQKHACFKQFVWACCNIFASFFALDVLLRTCSFLCLRLFCRNRSFYPCLRSFKFTREPRIHWKKCGWKSRAHFT